MESFLVSTGIVALAEMGDKTQLLSLMLAARFRKPWSIVLGILIATVANHAGAGAVGAWVADLMGPALSRWVLAASFLLMAVWVRVSVVVVALFCSTTVLYHVTFAVNSIGHQYGSRRYDTNDESRNSWWLALITAGEGWHNNHHRYPASERQGFYWWEVDFTHYAVVLLSWLRVVWDVRGPAPAVLREGSS